MASTVLVLLAAAGGLSALAWAGLLLHPARPWDLRPRDDVADEPAEPAEWPSVCAVVPARNEAASLPETLPSLLAQDYPGEWGVVVVDDRSEDGTAEVARKVGQGRVAVVEGAPLPAGWVGKVWALEQGVRAAAPDAAYLLFSDADIRHGPDSVRRLVAESEASGLALNSRMARLRCATAPERLLIPPFLFFFNCLYPMRWANDPARRSAAAAGGCELVRREVLERAGGPAAIRSEVIDDVSLARRIKALGEPIRLALSSTRVVSLREHGSVAAVWRMVRRTAFTQLRRSRLLLAVTLVGLVLLFPLPVALVGIGAGLVASGDAGFGAALLALGAGAWGLQATAFLPSVRFFGLLPVWALTLPLAGCLYAGMTLDSARQRESAWRATSTSASVL